MYIDPEKAHKERMLVANMSILDSLLFGKERIKGDLEALGKAAESKELLEAELKKLWSEMRNDHNSKEAGLREILIGIFISLVLIIVLLAVDIFIFK